MTSPTLLFDPTLLRPYLASAAQPWLVLTPNRRLASRIRVAVAAEQGGAAQPAAPVLALGDWLEQLWQQLVFCGAAAAEGRWVLNAAQELCLWEEAVRAGALPLLRPAQAAEQAASAYRTLALWRQLPLSRDVRAEFEGNPDSRALLEWLDRFEQLCAKKNSIAAAERDHRVVQAARAGQLPLPARIVGVGFDDIAPLYRELLNGVDEFVELALPNRQQHAACVGCDTLEEQLQSAALWVQTQLQQNPRGPFAIVVPDLSQQRAVVERVLLDIFTPQHALPTVARQLPPLNFSAGEPLAQTPIVRSALQLLELLQADIERETLLDLLAQSPFHTIETEHLEATSLCIEAICDLRVPTISAAQLRHIADGIAEKFSAWPLASALQQLAERERRDRLRSARYSPARWAEIFQETLTLLGWPGKRTLDSIEYQQATLWQQTLAQFCQFDAVVGTLDLNGALQRLRQLAKAQLFQPKTADTPVQVLGLLEAAGLQFKGLWLCDMGDDRWPPPASPHPLIPRDLQRRLHMPHCDAPREFAIAEKLSHSLLTNAERVVVSYRRESEEVARAPSPLFSHLPIVSLPELLGAELPQLLPSITTQQQARSRYALETFAAGAAPNLSDTERARGGSALFKNQADCPFQAFAKLRLGAQPLAEPVAGLDAAERGNLLHTALEWLWRELKNHARLNELSPQQQQQWCEQAANIAVQDYKQRIPHRIGFRFAELEQTRLAKLLNAWLDVERERGEFSVIATEQRQDIQFARLNLRLRVDRIDRLPDGRLLVIDYKTKTANSAVNEWLGARPDEPQLPLYSILLEQNSDAEIAGVLFAQVRLENPRLVGVGADDLESHRVQAATQINDEGATRDWSELKAHWRSVLENLAHEFIHGEARVAPKAPQVCTFCALAAVCRIQHRLLDAEELAE